MSDSGNNSEGEYEYEYEGGGEDYGPIDALDFMRMEKDWDNQQLDEFLFNNGDRIDKETLNLLANEYLDNEGDLDRVRIFIKYNPEIETYLLENNPSGYDKLHPNIFEGCNNEEDPVTHRPLSTEDTIRVIRPDGVTYCISRDTAIETGRGATKHYMDPSRRRGRVYPIYLPDLYYLNEPGFYNLGLCGAGSIVQLRVLYSGSPVNIYDISRETPQGALVYALDAVRLRKQRIECPICYEEAVHVARLPCGHMICNRCCGLLHHPTAACPMCREPFVNNISPPSLSQSFGRRSRTRSRRMGRRRSRSRRR